MALYTIPAGYTGYMIDLDSTMSRAGNNLADCTLRTRQDGGVFRVKRRWSLDGSGGDTHYKHDFTFPMELPAKTDIVVQCDYVSANGTGIAANFAILLEEA